MKRLLPAAILFGLLPALDSAAAPRYTPGEVLVAVDATTALELAPGAALRSPDPKLAGILARLGLARSEHIGAGPTPRGGQGILFLRLGSDRADFDPVTAAAELRASGRFRAAIPNLTLRLFVTLPNDPYLADQWYIHTATGAHVRLPEAWDYEQGSPSTVIGVMDTGVDLTHPDLASQIWTNPGEVPGNATDDDGNGYVDDVHGWDFGNDDDDPNPHAVMEDSGLGFDIDVGFHGTFVAGIADAATDNGEGIAGAGWKCRILPLKVVDSTGVIQASAVTAAFQYAAAMGVEVLNMSFGGPGDPGVPEYFQALVDQATAAGVVCVAAAGNDGSDVPSYPAACLDVLAVGATDESNLRADFSNWGSWVDAAAPGSQMWSALCQNYVIDDLSQAFYYLFFLWDGLNPYMFGDGTSFACPLVAGVCALVRSHFPALPAQALAQHVIGTGDVVAYDHPIGKRVNALTAVLDATAGVAVNAPTALRFERSTPNPFLSATTLAFTLPQEGPVQLRIYDCAGRLARELIHGPLGGGEHTVAWNGTGANGHRLDPGIYFAFLESRGRTARRKLILLH